MAVCAVSRDPVSAPIPVNRVNNSVLRASPTLHLPQNAETERARRGLATEVATTEQGKHQGANRERTGSETATYRSARMAERSREWIGIPQWPGSTFSAGLPSKTSRRRATQFRTLRASTSSNDYDQPQSHSWRLTRADTSRDATRRSLFPGSKNAGHLPPTSST